ncbi:hypothetical protein VCR15J2_630214 [Vibrio coralliirubri]|nr:hypothetical protein VCR15J2_630214 [Vibrio coralliirubri]
MSGINVDIDQRIVLTLLVGVVNLLIKTTLVYILFNSFLIDIVEIAISYTQIMVIVLCLILIQWRPLII